MNYEVLSFSSAEPMLQNPMRRPPDADRKEQHYAAEIEAAGNCRLRLFSGTIDPVDVLLRARQSVTGSEHRLPRQELGSKCLTIEAQLPHGPHLQKWKPCMKQRKRPEPPGLFPVKHVVAEPKQLPVSEQAGEVADVPWRFRYQRPKCKCACQAAVFAPQRRRHTEEGQVREPKKVSGAVMAPVRRDKNRNVNCVGDL